MTHLKLKTNNLTLESLISRRCSFFHLPSYIVIWTLLPTFYTTLLQDQKDFTNSSTDASA